MGRCRTKSFLLVAILTASLVVGSVTAQTYWMYPGGNKSITLQIFKPKFDHIEGFGTLTSAWFLSGRFAASERVDIFVDLPVSNFDSDNGLYSFGEDETLIGNPYLGIEARFSDPTAPQSFVGRFGVRPPFASDEKWTAVEVGYVSCFERFEAFFPHFWSLTFGVGHSHVLKSGIRYATNVDAVVIVPTEDGPDTEMLLNYNFEMWFQAQKFRFGGGFGGRWNATAEGADFGEASVHQLGFAGVFDLGRFDPGFHLRAPIDDEFSDFLDYVYGLSLTVDLK